MHFRIEHRFDTLAPKRILYWTTIFGTVPSTANALSDCKGLTDRCIFHTNHSMLQSADAVLFHWDDISSQPLPEASDRQLSIPYVFMTMEASIGRRKYYVPPHFFNWTMTPLTVSDVRWKYGPYFIKTTEAEVKGFQIESFYFDRKLLVKKKSGIVGLISNCDTTSKRERALAELKKYMNVTIGGNCATNEADRNLCPRDSKDSCRSFIAEYPFYVAIENTVCDDYITEKYWDRKHIPSIPIVMRRRIYEKNLPSGAFIAMDDFASPKDMADHLKYLERNQTAYEEYFDWRLKGEWTLAPWNTQGYRNGICKLCERLWEKETPSQSIEDVYKWYEENSHCERDEFVKSWVGVAA